MEKGLETGRKSRLEMSQNIAKNCLQNRPEPRAKRSKVFEAFNILAIRDGPLFFRGGGGGCYHFWDLQTIFV